MAGKLTKAQVIEFVNEVLDAELDEARISMSVKKYDSIMDLLRRALKVLTSVRQCDLRGDEPWEIEHRIAFALGIKELPGKTKDSPKISVRAIDNERRSEGDR